ncbi:hypothetical protein F5X99DRAFT_371794 [Biscogniauxia marginata]|nr:hypothetical protein F5X99DRAFT_371794 [Biscogniauxia marginata]
MSTYIQHFELVAYLLRLMIIWSLTSPYLVAAAVPSGLAGSILWVDGLGMWAHTHNNKINFLLSFYIPRFFSFLLSPNIYANQKRGGSGSAKLLVH